MLEDGFGRSFPYLRLSITDICNFRCRYCLPEGYRRTGKPSFLQAHEVMRLVNAFAELGVRKIRLTGGEPTIRRDFAEIAALISAHPSIDRLGLTTNGYRLRDYAQKWRDAGLTHINVSMDSLDADRFHAITGHDRLREVLEGIDAALQADFERVKVNVVLLKGVNDHELPDFLSLAQSTPISIRFIELMQTGDNRDYFRKYHLSTDGIEKQLLKTGWIKASRALDAGPARTYSHRDYRGSIGVIAPYSRDFCKGCNRLRVTATGDLRLCLFGSQGTGLRHLLQSDAQKPLLKRLIREQLAFKRSSHFLALGDTGITPHLASVGG